MSTTRFSPPCAGDSQDKPPHGDAGARAHGPSANVKRESEEEVKWRNVLSGYTREGGLTHEQAIQLVGPSPSSGVGSGLRAGKAKIEEKGKIEDGKRPVLMWHPSLDTLAHTILAISTFRASSVQWAYFPDKWPNITFEPSSTLINTDVTFLFSAANKEIFLEQLCLVMVLPRQLIRSLTIVMPYLGPATHERVEKSGTLATVEPVLKILSSCMPATQTGPPIVRIFDIHALPIRFYATDAIRMKLMSAIPLLIAELTLSTTTTTTTSTTPSTAAARMPTIAFPDEGAWKRFHMYFEDRFRLVVCSKIRDGAARRVTVRDTHNWPLDPAEVKRALQHVVIVDDLVQSGNTLVECAGALKAYGFVEVDAYVTHAVFPNDSHLKFVEGTRSLIRRFYVTNTNPEVTDRLQAVAPFHVLGIEQLLVSHLSVHLPSVQLRPFRARETSVYVASTNKDKLLAVHRFFSRMLTTHCLQVFAVHGCRSGVPEQPVGDAQTSAGAKNRLRDLEEFLRKRGKLETSSSDSDVWLIAIENGLICLDKPGAPVVDRPHIAILNEGRHYLAKGETAAVDVTEYKSLVDEAVRNPTITFGSLLEKQMGFPKGKWHEHVSPLRRTRADLIELALAQATMKDYADDHLPAPAPSH